MMWGRYIRKFLAKGMREQKFIRNFVIQIPTLKLQLCNIRIFVSNVFENVCFVCCFFSRRIFMHKLIAFEFQVLVLVVWSWDIFSASLESFLGNKQVVMFSLPTNKTCQQ